jgi:5-methylcytosine-specific restriction endonuclease McrA
MPSGVPKNGIHSGHFKKGHSGFWKGKNRKVSLETRKKMSLARKGGKKSLKAYKFPSGENHPGWKGGITKNSNYNTFRCARRRSMRLNASGSHSFGEWENLKAQYNWICSCCKKLEPKIKLTKDHIIPLSKGGSDNIENIQPLCRSCNSKKNTKTIYYNKRLEDL